MKRILLLSLMLSLEPVSATTIYSYIDEHGSRVFTDSPPDSAQPVEIQKITPPLPPPEFHPSSPPKRRVAPVRTVRSKPKVHLVKVQYRSLRIIHPEPDVTLPLQPLSVTIDNEPSLLPGHRYRLLLDGKPLEPLSESPLMLLDNLKSGTHFLAVEILDKQGKIVESTPNQPLHLNTPSVCPDTDCSRQTVSAH